MRRVSSQINAWLKRPFAINVFNSCICLAFASLSLSMLTSIKTLLLAIITIGAHALILGMCLSSYILVRRLRLVRRDKNKVQIVYKQVDSPAAAPEFAGRIDKFVATTTRQREKASLN